jgi:hypothetical protein
LIDIVVALETFQVKVEVPPEVIVEGEAPKLIIVGIEVAVFTVTVVDAVVLVPPGPLQLNEYVEVDVGFTDNVPEVDLVPLHAPDDVHDVALVDDQVRVEEEPDVMDEGLAERVTVGVGLPVTKLTAP